MWENAIIWDLPYLGLARKIPIFFILIWPISNSNIFVHLWRTDTKLKQKNF